MIFYYRLSVCLHMKKHTSSDIESVVAFAVIMYTVFYVVTITLVLIRSLQSVKVACE